MKLLFNLMLLRKKKKALQEVYADLEYLRIYKLADKAKDKISALRSELKKEQEKKEKANDNKIQDLAYNIAKYEDINKRYFNLLNAADDLEDYVELIKLWLPLK